MAFFKEAQWTACKGARKNVKNRFRPSSKRHNFIGHEQICFSKNIAYGNGISERLKAPCLFLELEDENC